MSHSSLVLFIHKHRVNIHLKTVSACLLKDFP
nr:MAG TPA: hypothetical protein [Caudoviricetes sp.]